MLFRATFLRPTKHRTRQFPNNHRARSYKFDHTTYNPSSSPPTPHTATSTATPMAAVSTMELIISFIWEKFPKYTSCSFDPFGFEEIYTVDPHIERIVDFVDEFDDPLAHLGDAKNHVFVDCELQHPRPVPRVALQGALSRFEKVWMLLLPDRKSVV